MSEDRTDYTTTAAPAPEPDAPGLVAELRDREFKFAVLSNKDHAAGAALSAEYNAGHCHAYRHAAKLAAPYEARLQVAEAERDHLRKRIELVHKRAEEWEQDSREAREALEIARQHACTCGVRPSPCLLCAAKAPCGLHAPGPDGKPDPNAGLVCEFDTFEGCLHALRQQQSQNDALRERVKALEASAARPMP